MSANLKAMSRLRRVSGALIITSAIACGVTACGGGTSTIADHQTATATPPPTVTTSTATVTVNTATAPATTTTAAGAACTAADLIPSFLGQNGATGEIVLTFALRNRGTTPCHTYGYPGVEFLAKSGAALPTDSTRTTDDILGSTPESELTLAVGQSASFRMVAATEAAGGGSCPTAAFLQIIAPDDTAPMRVALPNGVYECAKTTVSPLLPGSDAQPGV